MKIISKLNKNHLLTTLVQLNGNMSAICEMSRNNIRQVISREKIAQKTINLKRPMSGSKKRPTCTVPAEHSQARQAADDNCKIKQEILYK